MSLRRFLSSLAMFSLVSGAMLGAMQPAVADDDDDDQPNFMSQILGSVGLLQLPGPQIDYRERPPLVVPPISPYVQPSAPAPGPNTASSNPWDFNNPPEQNFSAAPQFEQPPQQALALPPPVDPNSVRQRHPDFPIDPEVKAAQKKKKNTKRIFSRAEDDPSYSGRTLRPDELKGVGPMTTSRSRGTGTDSTTNEAQSTVQQLNVPVISRLFRTKQQEERMEFTGEPERQTLTQPPSGYLTPSKNAPYGTIARDKQGRDTTRLVHPNMPDYSGPIPTR